MAPLLLLIFFGGMGFTAYIAVEAASGDLTITKIIVECLVLGFVAGLLACGLTVRVDGLSNGSIKIVNFTDLRIVSVVDIVKVTAEHGLQVHLVDHTVISCTVMGRSTLGEIFGYYRARRAVRKYEKWVSLLKGTEPYPPSSRRPRTALVPFGLSWPLAYGIIDAVIYAARH